MRIIRLKRNDGVIKLITEDDYKKTALAVLHTIFDDFEVAECNEFYWQVEVACINEGSFAELCRMWFSGFWSITVGPSTKQGKMVVHIVPLSPES